MNKTIFTSAVLLAAALGAAAPLPAIPESQVSSPVEEPVGPGGASSNVENSSWERKIAERREAREEILARLRQSSSQEKASVREEILKDRNQRFRNDENSSFNQSSPRNPERDWQRQDDRRFDPGREMQAPPPSEYGDPNF
ncbi:MAG: hypothetical protein M0P13_02485 [Fibrobacteraceae bacterium]|nr:hypothetical protein [Fibrobacteraceae bacterium]